MAQVTELLIQQIGGIAANYALNVAEPAHKLLLMREEIIEEGALINSFATGDVANKTLAAIDGGSLVQQLAGGDLLVTAATLGEGYHSIPLYPSDDLLPAEAFCEILPHRQSNSELLSAMRALIELRVWRKTETNVRIIDGAYLGNASTLLFALIKEDKAIVDTLLAYADFDADSVLQDALEELLNPSFDGRRLTVAVPKSDSSTIYTKHLFEEDSALGFKMTDRSLAGVLLRSGEFFEPRPLATNNPLLERLGRIKGEEKFITKANAPALLKRLLKGKSELLYDLSTQQRLWTTYFKPTLWSDSAPAIKLEFLYNPDVHGDIKTYAAYVVGIVDADIVDEAIMEPWSQYFADRRAKEVSVGADMIKNHLMATATTSYELTGLTRNYRT